MADYPWIASYPPPARWDAPITTGPVQDILDNTAAQFAELPAVDFMGVKLTYKELHALANRAAKGFQKLGVGPGVHVGLYLPNTPHYLVAFFGVLKAGGTVVNYSPLDAEKVLEHKVEDSETQFIVTLDLPMLYPQMRALVGHSGLRRLVIGGLADLGALKSIANASGASPSANGLPAGAEDVPFQTLLDNDGAYEKHPFGDPAETIAVLQYTGGTTGLPKGAMLTHGNLTAASSQYVETTKVDPPLLEIGRERTMVVLPLFHIYSLSAVMLLSVRLASEMVLHARFEAEAVIRDLAAKKVTAFFGVPTMFTALLANPAISSVDLTSLKYVASGGAPLPVELQHAFTKHTGCLINEGWGMTETSPAGTFTPARGLRKDGSCGIPVPHDVIELRDIGDPSKTVPMGERGEICIKGPNIMKGYWKNPTATAETIMPDGFMRTGDVAYMDADGFVFIVDRIKDMLLCGGFNVYPRNIEEAIYKHESVAEVSVIGIRDEYRGETPKAFIALKPGHGEFTLEHLKDFLKDKLGKHEMVAMIEFRESLPKTPVGKIQKSVLVDEERKKAGASA